MLRRKIIVLVLVMVITGLVACTPNTSTKPQESVIPQETTTVNKEETTSVEDGTSDVYRGVDVEDICKNLSINGKQVDFPWTLNSLGKEYSFEMYEVDNETKYGAALLMHQGKRVDIVKIKENNNEVSESFIIKITAERNNSIVLYDLDYEMDKSDVIKRFGQPNDTSDDEYYCYFYYETPELLIKIRFWKENEKLSSYTLEWTGK